MKKNLILKTQSALTVLDGVPIKVMRYACAFMVLAVGMLLAVNTAYADSASAIENGIKSLSLNVYNIVTAIFGPIAAAALAVTAIQILWGNSKTAEKAKEFAPKLVISAALVFLAPLLILQVMGWFSNGGTSKAFDDLVAEGKKA